MRKKLSAASTIVSFGLGEDVTFEMALIKKFGCRVIGFDPTPRSVKYIKENISNPLFISYPVALADHDGTLKFSLPPESVADQVSASAYANYAATHNTVVDVPCLTLHGIKQKFNLQKIDVLKMDIEGAEYSVIEQAVREGWIMEVQQLLVEFHHFLPGMAAAQTKHCVSIMLEAGFKIKWIGRTNHEYLFVR